MRYDILIKNARTRNYSDIVDIGIQNGKIVKIGSDLGNDAVEMLNADGGLVTESFVNGHLHLCKVYTLSMIGDEALKQYQGSSMGGAMTAIELAARVKEKYYEKWIIDNVRKACMRAIQYGNTHIRAFADTDTKAKLEGVKALLKAKEEFQNSLDLQVVAFPQDGVIRDPGAEEYVRQSLELGADVVGGIPWIEYTDEDAMEHINKMFDLAKRYNKGISMLIDDAGDPTLKTLEMLCVKTIKEGWSGRVTAQHARAMCLYPEPYFRKVSALIRKANLGVVSDPHTGPLHARVKELYQMGVNVALGQDDIADAYYPFGRNNMLEVAFLAAHLLWMTTFDDMNVLYDMITTRAAKALGIDDYGLEEGKAAHLVVLNAGTLWEAIWEHERPRYVIKDGKNVTLSACSKRA
ncbi:MAG TPA: amidohydrolase family protein [Acetomicrobium flavidum]|uniref:amidohydrolase family protein n=3 Tax=Acetomicrobium flavidum TaxID=49896 RepID=UPI002CDF6FDB|nr:amidohydrolase family protein [Acetomicrobium flavidum]HOM31014.1 amidohydrolase family protein [Acetomicrobium flavidum]HPP14280.1 amidohydrolase family protein [Acetomicrobium flavidum]